jgi:hypothetical protein
MQPFVILNYATRLKACIIINSYLRMVQTRFTIVTVFACVPPWPAVLLICIHLCFFLL